MLDLWTNGTLLEGMSTTESNPGNAPVSGKREQGVLEGPVGYPVNCMQGPENFDHVDCTDKKEQQVTLRSTKCRACGLYVSGFIGQSKIIWLIDTGAVRNILSYDCYKRLPEPLKFPLHEDGSQVFVADGRRANTLWYRGFDCTNQKSGYPFKVCWLQISRTRPYWEWNSCQKWMQILI